MQHIRSIQGAKVVHEASYISPYHSLGCTVTIDIAKCSGCTREDHVASDLADAPHVPGVKWNCLTRSSMVKSSYMPLSLMESELKLGDYGSAPQGGDIIELATGLALDPVEDDVRVIHGSASGRVELWSCQCKTIRNT